MAESHGIAFILDEKNISHMTSLYPHFREMLMRACLATTNDRIREANIERTINYTLTDVIESDPTRSIPRMLEILKKTFSVPEIFWIERHEILHDIFSLKYRSNHGVIPVNEKIDMRKYMDLKYIHETGFLGEGHAHIFPLSSRGECYGFLIYISEQSRLPGYVKRITTDIVPNCIRIIEESWKT